LKFFPFALDELKILENDLLYVPLVLVAHVETKGLLDIEISSIKPVLALLLRFLAMDVNGLVPLVGIEKKSPSPHKKNGRHIINLYQVGKKNNARSGSTFGACPKNS
jgi:hypothetical protein